MGNLCITIAINITTLYKYLIQGTKRYKETFAPLWGTTNTKMKRRKEKNPKIYISCINHASDEAGDQ